MRDRPRRKIAARQISAGGAGTGPGAGPVAQSWAKPNEKLGLAFAGVSPAAGPRDAPRGTPRPKTPVHLQRGAGENWAASPLDPEGRKRRGDRNNPGGAPRKSHEKMKGGRGPPIYLRHPPAFSRDRQQQEQANPKIGDGSPRTPGGASHRSRNTLRSSGVPGSLDARGNVQPYLR